VSAITFIIILAILVFVHELGHFLVAKLFGIRVDEFSIGFPPRLLKKQVGETLYSINLIPFGGYVKIFGENPDEESIAGPDSARSFVNKRKMIQVAVLVAGVVGNVAFAWMLVSFGNMFGMPTSVTPENSMYLRDAKVLITAIAPGSPATAAGIKSGDAILEARSGADVLPFTSITPESIQDFISSHGEEKLTLSLGRGDETVTIEAFPVTGIVEGRVALGISMDHVGLQSLPIHKAFYRGAVSTIELTGSTATGLYNFVTQAFLGKAKFSDVSGPVGIAGMVGEAQSLGFSYLIYFTALISINLAVINLVPFPALDGGRILFVAIEAIRRKAIPPHVANMLNGIGFVLLITLMLVVTYKDIAKLF